MDNIEQKQPLTLQTLYEITKAQVEGNPYSADCKVCIPNNKGGMGGTSVTYANHAGCGIDWDAKKFFIWPENKMIEAGQEPIKDWWQKAEEWALKQLPNGWTVSSGTPAQISDYYSFMLMFIRDCYSIYPKHI